MAKFRVKKSSKKNGQRWVKGQSSSSNPSKTKHRDAARSRMLRNGFGQQETPTGGPAKLTAECLLRHEALMGQASTSAATDGSESGLTLDASSQKTFASGLSQCTNVSFNKLTQRFDSNNAQHREMLAILAAITEVIKSKGGEESSTEYFAALLTTLETAANNRETCAAVISLLTLVIKSVPDGVLQKQFSPLAKLLTELLSGQQENDEQSVTVVRSLIGCLSVALRAQTFEAWNEPSTTRIFESVLCLSTHSKPRIRKSSHHAVAAILKGSKFMLEENAAAIHPGAGCVANFCISTMERHLGDANVNPVLHTMQLLKDVVSVFPKKQVKTSCETVLKIMASGEARALSCGFQVLHGLFAGRPSKYSLPAELNVQIISALFDYLPSINDAQPVIAWLTVQQEAHLNLSLQNSDLCLAHLPRFFSAGTRCWSSDRPVVCTAATTAMKAACNECIKPNVAASSGSSSIEKIFGSIEDGLKYQHRSSWPQVFHLLSVFVDVAGAHCSFVGRCLSSLADLRASVNFSLTNELDHVIGKAVRRMGPQAVLSRIPLNITGNETSLEFPRSWLLPILRETIQNTRIEYFKSYFLPLAAACKERANRAERNGESGSVAKTYNLLVTQIWSLLPGFCTNPVDLEAFRGLAKTLGETLQAHKELRIDILTSLRRLIMKSQAGAEVSKYAKNFLPILFNLYATRPVGAEETGQRQSVFATLKQYLTVADSKLLGEMFDKAFERCQSAAEDDFLRDSCLDILQALSGYQDENRVANLFKVCRDHLCDADHRKQKKSYKMLEELFQSETEACRGFVAANLNEIKEVFLEALSKASPSSQAYRLRCLLHVVRNLLDDHTEFVSCIVPEAVLCIKATNEKARTGAYTLLVVIGEALQRWGKDVKAYMQVILAGLAGSPTLIHCTVLAMTRIFYEFSDVFPDDLTALVVNNVCLLLVSQCREVAGSALSFLHVFVTAGSVLKSARHVELIVSSILKMTDDCRRHFRLKTRYLMDRLVRKFGFDLVSALVPKGDLQTHKRLKNIRKVQLKKKRERDAADRGDDEDSDEENDKFKIGSKFKTMSEILADSDSEEEKENRTATNKKKRKGKKSVSYIAVDQENREDGIVDFLDASASQNITQSLPQSANSMPTSNGSKKNPFPVAADGRMIIKDGDGDADDADDNGHEDEEAALNKKLKGLRYDSDEQDGDGEKDANTFRQLVSTNARKRKLGTSVASGRSKASTRDGPSMKYRTGGTGIHRPVQERHPDYGSEYRAKKGKGDVKRKGRPDPYAYVPLQKSVLNKRKKAKFEGQFKSLVKAAHRGVSSAKKGRPAVNKAKSKFKKGL